MPKLVNKQELMDFMGRHYDQSFKTAGYLFVGHGAGLGVCASILKDYTADPFRFKGLGLFFILFGAGLIATTACQNATTARHHRVSHYNCYVRITTARICCLSGWLEGGRRPRARL